MKPLPDAGKRSLGPQILLREPSYRKEEGRPFSQFQPRFPQRLRIEEEEEPVEVARSLYC